MFITANSLFTKHLLKNHFPFCLLLLYPKTHTHNTHTNTHYCYTSKHTHAHFHFFDQSLLYLILINEMRPFRTAQPPVYIPLPPSLTPRQLNVRVGLDLRCSDNWHIYDGESRHLACKVLVCYLHHFLLSSHHSLFLCNHHICSGLCSYSFTAVCVIITFSSHVILTVGFSMNIYFNVISKVSCSCLS